MARAIGFPAIQFPQAPHVRGGSVSRRGLNQAYRRKTALPGGTPYAEATNSNASRSSGERGLGGEALLSEKRPLPPASPTPASLQEGARGRGLLYREAPSLAYPSFSHFVPFATAGNAWYNAGDHGDKTLLC